MHLSSNTFSLVRYYKNQQFVSHLKIFTIPTTYHLNTKIKDLQGTIDTFLFMLESQEDLEIYPFNQDPRTINLAYNAVKFKTNKVK